MCYTCYLIYLFIYMLYVHMLYIYMLYIHMLYICTYYLPYLHSYIDIYISFNVCLHPCILHVQVRFGSKHGLKGVLSCILSRKVVPFLTWFGCSRDTASTQHPHHLLCWLDIQSWIVTRRRIPFATGYPFASPWLLRVKFNHLGLSIDPALTDAFHVDMMVYSRLLGNPHANACPHLDPRTSVFRPKPWGLSRKMASGKSKAQRPICFSQRVLFASTMTTWDL